MRRLRSSQVKRETGDDSATERCSKPLEMAQMLVTESAHDLTYEKRLSTRAPSPVMYLYLVSRKRILKNLRSH